MNIQSNALPQSLEGQRAAPISISVIKPFYWLIRCELWENRSIYLAPLGVAAAFLVGFPIVLIHLPAKVRHLAMLDLAQQHGAIALPYDIVAGLLMATMMIIGAFYCLDALYGERRDRTLLFWKSLPVSDLATVLSKITIPLLVLPLITFGITVAAQWIMLLLSTAVLWLHGLSAAVLWTQLSFVQMSFLLLYHLLTVHALWTAPIFGWLLLVSAWARRAPFLWATLPLVAIGAIEKLVFNTSYFASLLANRLTGNGSEAITAPDTMPMDPGTHVTFGKFLTAPGLWMGLLFAALCVVAAAKLRRSRELS